MTTRTELIEWVNSLLQLNYTKVEQCGSGAAYCQILDSIYGDVPMTRVKMTAKHEYEFVQNFKVLQNVFKAHKVDKPIPVEKLTKCKMQDNLEFLQWLHRFWEANYGGHPYDPVARRKGAPGDPPATVAPISAGRAGGLAAGGARAGGRTPVGGARSGSAASNETVIALQNQLREMTAQMEGLEKERDFYFEKLRDIEILVQQQMDVLEPEGKTDATLKDIQRILYMTEDGFEVPAEGSEGAEAAPPVDEEETF